MSDDDAFDRAIGALMILVGGLIAVPVAILAAPMWVPLACIVRFLEWYVEGGRR